MVKDMTAGSPLKLILQFSLPLLASNLVQQTYNVVDAAIVGRVLGADALACVGTSSSVQFLVLGFCMGLCSGFGVPMAMHFGGHEESELKKDVYHAAIGTLLFGAALTIVTALLTRTMLHALKTPDDIFEGAAAYLLILFLGIPFTLLYNLTASILRAVGNSRTPFLITPEMLESAAVCFEQWHGNVRFSMEIQENRKVIKRTLRHADVLMACVRVFSEY